MITYRPFTDLNVGFSNAENYQRRENKNLLAKYFVRDEFLDRILDPNIYYLVGEKGTGKTAYATFLKNNNYRNHSDPSFRDAHAEYLLGEIRDQLLFYYSQDEFDLFLQFFSHLRGKRTFTYDQFLDAFNEFISECSSAGKKLPQFFESANVFLQFIYEQNVVCYKERDASKNEDAEPFIRWCFRERTLSNMAPKVRAGVDYEIFYGLSKALNVGRPIRIRQTRTRRQIGTIISLNIEKGFGFIRGGEQQAEYYFKITDFKNEKGFRPRISQKVSFEVQVKYGKPRALTVTPEK